jgi:hypothetical protein
LRLATHPGTGAVWQVEMGPNGGDEVNILQAGANYGWLFFLSGTRLMALPAEPGGAFPTSQPTAYRDVGTIATENPGPRNFDVDWRTGRVLVVRAANDTLASQHLIVAQDWSSELERLVPTD